MGWDGDVGRVEVKEIEEKGSEEKAERIIKLVVDGMLRLEE